MKTIYKDNDLMIKIDGEQNCIYYKGLRCNLGDLYKTEQLTALAPLFKIIIERYLDLGRYIGYNNGYIKGHNDLQDSIKKLLGIKEDEK